MKASVERAIANVVAFGDTDIFPFPPDNVALRENAAGAANVCLELHKSIDDALSNNPPSFYDSFVPNGHTGFRWATQIDTFWNAYFLSLVVKIGPQIEAARLKPDLHIVHSYRFLEGSAPELWDKKFGWKSFYEKATALAESHKYIVICDVSEFYRRVYHHRLENALKQIDKSDIPSRIMKFLSAFSGGTSYGLPIGGPAARLLSELVLNQIDHLLHNHGYKFCRFADDFVLAADSQIDAYNALLFLSEKLQINQGLALQRAKTRILTSSEYKSSQPLILDDDDEGHDFIAGEKSKLFSITVYYDPYSPTASDDYTALQDELHQIDILSLLNHEIKKSRIHIPTINRIVRSLKHLKPSLIDESVMTIVTNLESFHPCLSSILITLNDLMPTVSSKVKDHIVESVMYHFDKGSHLLKTEAFQAFAVRILAKADNVDVEPFLLELFDGGKALVRREVLIALAFRHQWMMLSDLRHQFPQMTRCERRAMIPSSYVLGDEGHHWRQGVSKTFDPFETFVAKWFKSRSDKSFGALL